MRLRVAIIAPDDLPIPPTRGGSVQIYLSALCKHLAPFSEISATLLSPGSSAQNVAGVHHIPIPKQKLRTYLADVIHHVKNIKPDVVQVENRPHLLPQIRKAVPSARIILNLHSVTFLGPKFGTTSRMESALRTADTIVVNSHYLRNRVQKKFHLPSSSFRVIYPGVETTLYKKTMSMDAKPHTPARILFVGRVIELKGVHVLLDAVSHLNQKRPVQLTIVGRTPPWERTYGLRMRAKAKRLPVKFAGFVSPKDIPKYLHHHDVLVCPSQRDEAFGLVNVEAMSAGLPVVASQVGGIPEVVSNESGLLVKRYKDPVAFANALNHIISSPERWKALSVKAKKRAAHFTWKRTAQAFVKLYTDGPK